MTIMAPDFIDRAMFSAAVEKAEKKLDAPPGKVGCACRPLAKAVRSRFCILAAMTMKARHWRRFMMK
jgi:hypothetical protein